MSVLGLNIACISVGAGCAIGEFGRMLWHARQQREDAKHVQYEGLVSRVIPFSPYEKGLLGTETERRSVKTLVCFPDHEPFVVYGRVKRNSLSPGMSVRIVERGKDKHLA